MYYDSEAGMVDSLRKSLGAYRRQNEDLKNKILAIRCEVAKIKYDIKTKWWSHEIPDELVQRLRKLAE